MAEGLRTVLSLVQKHQHLRVFWTVNYGLEDPSVRTHLLGQLQKPRCEPTTSFPDLRHPSLPPSSWSHCIQEGSMAGWRCPLKGHSVAAVLGQDWAHLNVLTSFSLCPAPRPPHGLTYRPAPSLLPTFPTCLPTPALPSRPLILDPADPTWNVAHGSWELLAKDAAALETQACLMSREGTPVKPWDVMVRRGSQR